MFTPFTGWLNAKAHPRRGNVSLSSPTHRVLSRQYVRPSPTYTHKHHLDSRKNIFENSISGHNCEWGDLPFPRSLKFYVIKNRSVRQKLIRSVNLADRRRPLQNRFSTGPLPEMLKHILHCTHTADRKYLLHPLNSQKETALSISFSINCTLHKTLRQFIINWLRFVR